MEEFQARHHVTGNLENKETLLNRLKMCLNMCNYKYMDVCMCMFEQRAKQRQGDGMKDLEGYA